MTLSSRHRIRNSSPGGLRPSTLPLGHGGSPQFWLSHMDGEETFFVSFKPPRPGTERERRKKRSRDYALRVFQMTSRFFYSAQYHRQNGTFQAFEQFGALCMHNHDDKYLAPPGNRAWYLQVTTLSRNEWAIGAGSCFCKIIKRFQKTNVVVIGVWKVRRDMTIWDNLFYFCSIIIMWLLVAKNVSTTSRQLLSQFSTCSGWG